MTYSAWWSPIVRAGTGIGRIPRRAAIFSWVASPSSPSEASVPAPPPSMATNTRASQACSRSTWRPSSSIQTATLKPNVAGTACWPWVRPGSSASLVRSARSARWFSMLASWRRKISWARRTCKSWPVCVMFCVVAPQCTYPPASPSQARSSAQTTGTSGWPVLASPARTSARSRYFSCALATISRAAFAGMMPSSACASASAASTSSHDWKRAASVNSARTPGSSMRSEVGSSSMGTHLRRLEPVDARGIAPDDLRLLVVGHARQNLGEDLARLRERGLAVRIVRAPHHVVDADHVAQANADRVLLEAQHDVPVEEVAWLHAVLEAIDRLAGTLAIGVVHRRQDVRRPRELELDDRDGQPRIALEHAREDHVAH